MFTQKISMNCTSYQFEKELKDELVKIGYDIKDYRGEKLYPYITNNLDEVSGSIGSCIEGRHLQVGRTYYREFNAPLFLALAAMTDKEYGGYGEHWTPIDERCNWTVGKLYKAIRPVNKEGALVDDSGSQNGFRMAPFKNIRKATKEEIIEYYTNTNTVVETKSFKTTRESMKSIYDIACPTWKLKIEELTNQFGITFNDEVILPKDVVKTMFEAATPDQKEVLNKVFPKYKTYNTPFIEAFGSYDISGTSEKLFGTPNLLQIATEATDEIGRRDLKGRALYFGSTVKVVLHECKGGDTIVELIKN